MFFRDGFIKIISGAKEVNLRMLCRINVGKNFSGG